MLENALDVENVEKHRSEEHTSELQSRQYLVCRLLLEKKHTTAPTCASWTICATRWLHPAEVRWATCPAMASPASSPRPSCRASGCSSDTTIATAQDRK